MRWEPARSLSTLGEGLSAAIELRDFHKVLRMGQAQMGSGWFESARDPAELRVEGTIREIIGESAGIR